MEPLEAFSDQQFVTLMNAIRVRPGGFATEDEMQRLYQWAGHIYTAGLLLDLLLGGEAVVVGFEGEQPRFASPEHADEHAAVMLAEQILGEGA
jgi:hypothetical protein